MSRPLIVYDGACAFCEWWARYWQRSAWGRFDIAAYQNAALAYPQIPAQEFQRAVQFRPTAKSRALLKRAFSR